MDTVTCPKCGTVNPVRAMNCKRCRINLEFALNNPSTLESPRPEAIQPPQDFPSTRHLLAFLLIIATSVLGFLGWRWLGQNILEGTFVRWQSLGSPPEQALRIHDVALPETLGKAADVYVKTGSGQVYYCCNSAQTRWERAAPVALPYREECAAYPIDPPGTLRDCAEVNAWEYVLDRWVYVILQDGTIWIWRHHVGLLTHRFPPGVQGWQVFNPNYRAIRAGIKADLAVSALEYLPI